MKKLLFKTLLLSALLFAAFAKNDPYDKETLKVKGRTGWDKFLGTNRYDILDECYMYIKPIVGKIGVKKGNFIYRRGTDIAGFRIYYDSSAYAVHMSREARLVFCQAVDAYIQDFEEKKLDKKMSFKKTRAFYGSALGYEEYGVAIGMMNYYSKPKFSFGYQFVKENPYFVIHVAKSENLATQGRSSSSAPRECIAQTYYFTRKQAQAMRIFLSEENIASLLQQETENFIKSGSEADDYAEADADADVKAQPKDYTEAGDQ